jgi:quinol monooxygenase YgiN
MIHIHVTYRIRNEHLAEAEREISAFVESLRSTPPRFETYQVFRQSDAAAAYVHVIAFKDHEAQLEHTQSAHVKTFVENMVGFCEVGPDYTELNQITSMAR